MPSRPDEKRLVTSWKGDKLVVQEKTYEHGGWVTLRIHSEEDLKKIAEDQKKGLLPPGHPSTWFPGITPFGQFLTEKKDSASNPEEISPL